MSRRGAVDSMFSLALKYHSHPMSAKTHEISPHLAKLNNLDSSPFHMNDKVINRPSVGGAVLKTPLLIIREFIIL